MEVPSAFETTVLAWISRHSDDPALREQLAEVGIHERKYTGVGCYSTLAVPPGVRATTQPYAARGPLDGPVFEADTLEHGGGALLWFEKGRADCLEIYVFGEQFPEDHADLGEFRLVSPLPER